MISGGFMTWSKRKKLLELAERTLIHCQKCKKLEDHSSDYSRLRRRIRRLSDQYFFVFNLSILVAILILMRMDTDQFFTNATMIALHNMQFAYVVIMTAGLYVILLVLHCQSKRVHLALRNLSLSLHHEERNFLVLSGGKARKSLDNLRNLFQLCIETSRYTKILVVITHYWSAVLLMNVVDDVTRRSGSQVGDILREFTDL